MLSSPWSPWGAEPHLAEPPAARTLQEHGIQNGGGGHSAALVPRPGALGLNSSQRVSPQAPLQPPGSPSGPCVRDAGFFQDWYPPPTRGYVSYHITERHPASDPVG